MRGQTSGLLVPNWTRLSGNGIRLRATLRLLLVAVGLAGFSSHASMSVAATIVVDARGRRGFLEIQAAIDEAANGDTVLVQPGEYLIAEPLRFSGKRIAVRSEGGPAATTIRMVDEPVDSRRASVVVFDSGERRTTALEGFTLTGGGGLVNPGGGSGEGGFGGGVYCADGSSPTIVNCAITSNSAKTRGGGVYCLRSSPAFAGCTITGNSADLGGGVFVGYDSFPTLTSCIVSDNAGGSVYALEDSAPHVAYSCIEGHALWPGLGNINADPLFCGWSSPRVLLGDQRSLEEALRSGFSIRLAAGSPCLGTGEDGADMGASVGRCDLPGERSRAIDLAPGVYRIQGLGLAHRVSLRGAGADDTVVEGTVLGLRTGASLAHVTVTGGTSGGIRIAYAEAPEILSSTISRNDGSGIHCGVASSSAITDCTVTENRGTLGGGVHVEASATPTFAGCRITRNVAQRGGGIHVASIFPAVCDTPGPWETGAAPSFVDCEIRENWSRSGGGGAFLAEGSLVVLKDCDLTYNATLQSGGGLSSRGASVTLSRCSLAANSAGVHGGGAYLWAESSTVTNCVVAANLAKRGGGLLLARSFSAIVNCTVAGNLARESGAGIFSYQSPVTITNSIVWNSSTGSIEVDADSEVEIIYSCVATDDVWPGRGNINSNPRFEDPGLFDFDRVQPIEIDGELHDFPDFVVEAFDYRLEPDSPCVDAGRIRRAATHDFDEKVRPCGPSVDMGAFESGDCLPVRFLRGDCNGDGRVDLSDAVCILSWLFAGGDRPGCPAALNVNGEGLVEIADAIQVLSFLFAAGPSPVMPYPFCGSSGLAPDRDLGCGEAAQCP